MSEPDLFNDLAHEFAERYRRGEHPTLSEYAEQYPELAADIRELFPSLVMMEELGSDVEQPTDIATTALYCHEPAPQQLGDYRILREIGRGGMGIVYEAVQESLGRHVALKVLPPNRQKSPIQLMRFQREARAAALLHHTNIVPVFGVGEHEGVHYYAMQYIEGQGLDSVLRDVLRFRLDARQARTAVDDKSGDLSARLASGLLSRRIPALRSPAEGEPVVPERSTRAGASARTPLGPSTTESLPLENGSATSSIMGTSDAQYFRTMARIGAQAAEALAYAHLHGVVHRDIKPSNLLLDLQGTLWVTDFGLAKAEGSHDLTSPGDVVGTLRYMAPERFSGQTDARSDVYSLGLTLYEMLTLTPAFTASHRPQLINSILNDEPVRPRKHDSRVPLDLETIVQKAIAKAPTDRFKTADEVAKELRRFIEGRPIRSRRMSVPERVWRWSRRNPAIALLILLAACLSTMLVAGSTAAAWKFREQRDAVWVQKKEALDNLDLALAKERERRAELGRTRLARARAERFAAEPGRRSDRLGTLAQAAEFAREVGAPPEHLAQLRDELIASLALDTGRQAETWSGLRDNPAETVFAPEDDRYVVLAPDHSIHVRRLSDGSEVKVMGASSPSPRGWPQLARGGRFLTTWSAWSRIELWDLERGEVPRTWPADVRGAALRDDGKQVAAVWSDGELHVYDLPAMTEVLRLSFERDISWQFSIQVVALSHDGRYVALRFREPDSVGVYDTAKRRVVRELKFPAWRVWGGLALSRDGGLLALIHDRAISVYDVHDGEQLSMLEGHQSEGIVAQFQPGGSLLASCGWDGMIKVWDPIRGRLLLNLPGDLRGWTANGSSIAIARERDLTLYQIAAVDERRTIDCRTLSDRPSQALYGPARVAFSPDCQLIAMAVRPDGVRIVRASDGAGLANLPIGNCDEVLFLPGGAILTVNGRGLCLWPVKHKSGGVLRVGPPEPLVAIGSRGNGEITGMSASADGRKVGATSPAHPGAVLVDAERPGLRTWLIPHQEVVDLSISPDGRWAATSGRGTSPGAQELIVWDTGTAKPVVRKNVGSARVEFSPDGKWLGVGGEVGYEFYSVGSWAAGPRFDHRNRGGMKPLAFHPRGRIVATIDSNRSTVQLIDVEAGGVVASLEAPDSSMVYSLAFSPNGRYLAVPRSDQRIDLWDCSAIRRRLVELHLEGELPDIFDGGPPPPESLVVNRIEVIGADAVGLNLLAVRRALREAWHNLRALVDPKLEDAHELSLRADQWGRMGHWQLAAADYRASLARRPGSSSTANALAWCLVIQPGRGDTAEALRWAREAVRMRPDDANIRNTLGVALYRAGDFPGAATMLEANAPRDQESGGIDWLVVAMCRQRMGRAALARDALEKALRWRAEQVRTTVGQNADFQGFFRETDSLLNEGVHSLPTNVFAP
jgi:eukaryotic-like serine/threonine-protein kinase